MEVWGGRERGRRVRMWWFRRRWVRWVVVLIVWERGGRGLTWIWPRRSGGGGGEDILRGKEEG